MNNLFALYILKCSDNSYYIGHTDNLEVRLTQHSEGHNFYTANRLPVLLLYIEYFQTRDEAFQMERKIKGWSRNKKEALVNNDDKKLSELSRKKFIR